MPKLVKRLSREEFRKRGSATPRLDLEPYFDILRGMSEGEGAEVALDSGEKQRVVKRRFSMSAAQNGQALKWRTAPEGHLRFQVVPKKAGK